MKVSPKLNDRLTINCPVHGKQKTRDILEGDEIGGVACEKCYRAGQEYKRK